jgi:hypothetical protein
MNALIVTFVSWCQVASAIAMGIALINVPFLMSRRTRPYAAVVLYFASWTWGLALWSWAAGWIYGAHSWPAIVVLILLSMFFRFGVVGLVAFLALINGDWRQALGLTISVILIYAVRFGSMWLGSREESQLGSEPKMA